MIEEARALAERAQKLAASRSTTTADVSSALSDLAALVVRAVTVPDGVSNVPEVTGEIVGDDAKAYVESLEQELKQVAAERDELRARLNAIENALGSKPGLARANGGHVVAVPLSSLSDEALEKLVTEAP